MNGFEEKRQFPRVALKTPLRYQIRGKAEAVATLSADVCLGGVRCMAPAFIAPQTLLDLDFQLLSRPITATGVVRRAFPEPHSDRYTLGIEFVEINDYNRRRLSEYLQMKTGPVRN